MIWLRNVLMILMATGATAFAQDAETTEKPTYDPAKIAEVLSIQDSDVVHGDDNAPLTMIEYASLSCSHCANFHNTVLPTIKKEYIETGKLRFVNRDFPLNASALKGAMLIQCAPEGKSAQFKKVLYKLQSKWAYAPDYEDRLKKIAKVGGMSEESFDACMSDESVEEAVLKTRQTAGDSLPIEGTPAFFLNGEPLNVALTVEAFREALNSALAEAN